MGRCACYKRTCDIQIRYTCIVVCSCVITCYVILWDVVSCHVKPAFPADHVKERVANHWKLLHWSHLVSIALQVIHPPENGENGGKHEKERHRKWPTGPQEVPNRSPRGLGGPLEVQISAKARSSWFFWQPTSARQGPGCGNMSLLMVDSGGLMDVNDGN
jgi:hypothetical protein